MGIHGKISLETSVENTQNISMWTSIITEIQKKYSIVSKHTDLVIARRNPMSKSNLIRKLNLIQCRIKELISNHVYCIVVHEYEANLFSRGHYVHCGLIR